MYIDLENLINLSAVPGIGPTKVRALVAHFKATSTIFQASIKELTTIDGVDYKTAKKIKEYQDFDFGKKEVEQATRLGINLINFWDERYPENLKRIYDPPVLLYVKGDLKKEDKYAISVVGTRMPTSYGKLVAEKFSSELAQLGFVIVSGLARGIDTLSHWAAVKNGGRTVAVLGSGLNKIYPSENKKLCGEIIKNGALISEFTLDTGPEAVNFPRRNRIISGLALGTIVVEAGEKSGALLTANYALDQNREIFAVPGNISSAKSVGSNLLIKNGAKLICSVTDVTVELEAQLKYMPKKGQPLQHEIPADLSEAEKKVMAALSNEPIHIDKLAQLVGASTAETLSLLLPLEFKELVKQIPGKLFIRI